MPHPVDKFSDDPHRLSSAVGPRRIAGKLPVRHVGIVLDGAGWHKSNKLVVPETISLLRLPPYAPELNPVENIWQYLRGDKLAHRLYDSYEAIVEACCEAWNWLIAAPDTITSIAARNWANVSA